MIENHHLLIIPPPFQGHLNPFIQLTLKLAAKGFKITFVNSHSTHDQITKARNEFDKEINIFSESGFDISYEMISDGFPLTFDRSLNEEQFIEGWMHVYPAHVDELVGRLKGSDHPPTGLIVDTFSSWGSPIARKYGLVYISFWTQPAIVFVLYKNLDLLKKNGHYGCIENRTDTIDYIPGLKAIEPRDIASSFLQETDTSNVLNRLVRKAFEDANKSDLIICNTVQELEPEPISAIRQSKTTYPIGPLFPDNFASRAVPTSLWSESDCTKWLDTKPKGSVLYASFGSVVHADKSVINEIGNGLVHSQVNFLWVLRPDIVSSQVKDFLPVGFQERVGDKCLIVPWCNQNAVIKHTAIGGFLTHCGWNSILESVWCGVPLICYPVRGDQITNRKLVVDDWKIGINLCDGESVSSSEVSEKIKFLMDRGKSDNLRKGVEEVRKKLENALSVDGSTAINFNRFVENVKEKIEKNKVEK